MIQEKIENAILDYSIQYGKNGTVILIHPKTYYEFEVEIRKAVGITEASIFTLDSRKTIVFKGYEIFRTTDIERNEIRIV